MTEYINKILNIDALDLLKSIPDNSIDLIITDPPYGINYKNNRRKIKGKIKTEKGIMNDKDNIEFLSQIIKECFRVLKEGRHFYWFGRYDTLPEQIIKIKENGFQLKNNLIWLKNNHGTGDLYYSYGSKYENILYCNKPTKNRQNKFKLQEINGIKRHSDILEFKKVGNEKIHDHQKPIDLLSFLIKKSSIEGELVLDPFCGSGSTAIASKKLKRDFITTEKDLEIYKLSKKNYNFILNK